MNLVRYGASAAALLCSLVVTYSCSVVHTRPTDESIDGLVQLPAGTFDQGDARQYAENAPVHAVALPAFRLGQFEVTKGEFSRFVNATKYVTDAEKGRGCYVVADREPALSASANWRNPGFPQGDDHPVVCVTWGDANAYLTWLAASNGKRYRLPTESEFEYATRAGSVTTWPWGDAKWGDSRQCGPGGGNVLDLTSVPELRKSTDYVAPCADGYVFTSPVGRFGANAFGISDINGNVSEWVQDCYRKPHYDEAPADGSAWEWEGCAMRAVRGGNWGDPTPASSARSGAEAGPSSAAYAVVGFRVAR